MAAPVPSAYYAPPPNQTPNIFAAFWSGFMQTRNPWATELFFQRLAENPEAERDALLLEHLKLRLQQGEENGRNERAMRTSDDKRTDAAVKVYQADKSYQGAQVAAKARVVTANIGLDETRLERQNLSTESTQNAMNEALKGVKNGMAALEKATTPKERRVAYGILEKAGKELSGNLNDSNDRAIASKQVSQVINASGGRIQSDDIQTALESIGVGFGGDLGEPKPEFRPADRGLGAVAPSAGGTSVLAGDVLSKRFSGQIAAPPAAVAPSSARAAESGGAATTAPVTGGAPVGATTAPPSGTPIVVSRTLSGPVSSVLAAGQGNVSRLDALADQINARPPRRRLGQIGSPLRRDPTFSEASGIDKPRTAEEAADLIAALREMAEGRKAEEAAEKVAEERVGTGRAVKLDETPETLSILAEERKRLTAPRLGSIGTKPLGRPEPKTTALAAAEELQKEDLDPENREFLESLVGHASGSIAKRRAKSSADELTQDSALDEFGQEDLDPERRKVLEDFLDRENQLVAFQSGTSLEALFGEDLTGIEGTTRKEGRALLAEDAAEELVGNGVDEEDEENKKKGRGRGPVRK